MAGEIFNCNDFLDPKKALLIKQVEELRSAGIYPGLGVVFAGNAKDAASYRNSIKKLCLSMNFNYFEKYLEEDSDLESIKTALTEINLDSQCHGYLVQKPLPSGVYLSDIIDIIPYEKDIEGITVVNNGLMFYGKPCFLPCTAKAVYSVLKYRFKNLSGLGITIIGASDNVGKPLALLLINEFATVSICNIYTKNISDYTKEADIIVLAAGSAEILKADMVKYGVSVIDVGMNYVEDKLVGDADFEALIPKVSFITPVLGGIGPITTFSLLENCMEAAIKWSKKS